MIKYLLIFLTMLASVSSWGAEAPERFLQDYARSLENQDIALLTDLIADDAEVQIIIEPEHEPAFTLTLNRHEYLQHLRTLWHFSDTQSYQQSGLTLHQAAQGMQASLQQREQYRLFGDTLTQHNRIRLTLQHRNETLVITHIEARTHQW